MFPPAWPKMHNQAMWPRPGIQWRPPPFAGPTQPTTRSKSSSCPPPRSPAVGQPRPSRSSIIHPKWNPYDSFRAYQAAFGTSSTTARSRAEASSSSSSSNRSRSPSSSSASASPSRSRSFSRSYSEGTKDDNYRCRCPHWGSKELEADGQPLWTPKMKDMWRKAQKRRRAREKAGLGPYPSPPRSHRGSLRPVSSSSESPPPTSRILQKKATRTVQKKAAQ